MPDQPIQSEPGVTRTEHEFDLSPSPRILPMLGEIKLEEWQCIAELVDNAIDGFLLAKREGQDIDSPEIHIQLPTRQGNSARIGVRDNGPGMSAEKLENAVKAGWTSNDPLGSLGLFGMGFNIATARLGSVTRVWSTRSGDDMWHGIEIDFQRLIAQRHFRTAMLVRSKSDPQSHGTEVAVERLKPDHVEWFARAANHSRLRGDLSEVYSAVLRHGGDPLAVSILVNGTAVRGRRHCVWGGPESADRVVNHSRFGDINAFQPINHTLPPRPYCIECWYWLPVQETVCPSCGSEQHVVERERRVKGWLGIQRFLDQTGFGIDFFRNGRKIERGNQDLFYWNGERGREREYPIDDPRHRGRIVGEIHLDHAKVYYTKDRFERHDPAWSDMVRLVRGDGPLRPDKARALGIGTNESPLFRLFQAFRRSSPKPKVAGAYANLLVVPDNDRAKEMASNFHAGDAGYQSDEKWYELVEEADRALLTGSGGGVEDGDFWDDEDEGGDLDESAGEGADGVQEDEELPPREPIASLTRYYRDEITDQKWEVEAFTAHEGDPGLGDRPDPWALRRTTSGPWEFLINPEHPVFRSATMTPLDALLAELSWSAMDFLRGRETSATFSAILASLRGKYASRTELDPIALHSEAAATLKSVASSLSRSLENDEARVLYEDLSAAEQRHVLSRLATTAGADAARLIEEGRFLEYAPRSAVVRFFETHPELFFDGQCWDVPYEGLDLGDPQVTDEARRAVLRRYSCLMADAVWLADQDPADLENFGRNRLLRGMLALDLLTADMVEEA